MKPNNQSPFTNFRQGSTREREREWWGERKLGYQRRKERNQRRRTGDKSKEQARPHVETSLSITLTSLFLPSFLLYLFLFLLLMSSFSPPLSLRFMGSVCADTTLQVITASAALRCTTTGPGSPLTDWRGLHTNVGVSRTNAVAHFFHHRSLKGKVWAFGGGVVWGFSLSRDVWFLTDTLDARIIIHHHDTKKKAHLKWSIQFKYML